MLEGYGFYLCSQLYQSVRVPVSRRSPTRYTTELRATATTTKLAKIIIEHGGTLIRDLEPATISAAGEGIQDLVFAIGDARSPFEVQREAMLAHEKRLEERVDYDPDDELGGRVYNLLFVRDMFIFSCVASAALVDPTPFMIASSTIPLPLSTSSQDDDHGVPDVGSSTRLTNNNNDDPFRGATRGSRTSPRSSHQQQHTPTIALSTNKDEFSDSYTYIPKPSAFRTVSTNRSNAGSMEAVEVEGWLAAHPHERGVAPASDDELERPRSIRFQEPVVSPTREDLRHQYNGGGNDCTVTPSAAAGPSREEAALVQQIESEIADVASMLKGGNATNSLTEAQRLQLEDALCTLDGALAGILLMDGRVDGDGPHSPAGINGNGSNRQDQAPPTTIRLQPSLYDDSKEPQMMWESPVLTTNPGLHGTQWDQRTPHLVVNSPPARRAEVMSPEDAAALDNTSTLATRYVASHQSHRIPSVQPTSPSTSPKVRAVVAGGGMPSGFKDPVGAAVFPVNRGVSQQPKHQHRRGASPPSRRQHQQQALGTATNEPAPTVVEPSDLSSLLHAMRSHNSGRRL